MAEANLRKAKAKVAEKDEAIEGFDRAVQRSERELAAVVARVKEEEVDEVVELDVEAEEVEEEILKEEEEEAKAWWRRRRGGGGVSQWLRGMMGSRDAGALQYLPWNPAVLAGPHPPNLDTPSSSPRGVRYGLSGFCWCGCTTDCSGRGLGMGGRGGGCPPGQAPAPRGGQRVVVVAT